ncbi:hypothetical protein [Terribacillus sp. JSM ZJ617]|uniref:hypothetical protein n=1 Tax=Terribacillus sp. JSM ZJ617 TaxID=3342119 RepID=UPI0035A87833
MPYKLDLQFFADGDDDEGGDEDDGEDDDDQDDDEGEDEELDLQEMIKNDPKLKKQHTLLMKKQLAQRMKRYKDVDPEEYRRLKQQAEKGKGKDAGDDEGDESLNKEQEQRLLRAERREKRALVKEEALNRGYDPKLVARLIDLNEVDLDEDGESDNLDELIDGLEEEFGHVLGGRRDEDDDDEEEDEPSPKKKAYKPGRKQKNNKKTKKVDLSALGAAKAAERHKKKEA